MSDSTKNEIFNTDTDDGTFESITAGPSGLDLNDDFDTDFSDFNLALSDDELDATRSRFKPIPADTRVNLTITKCERGMTRSDKRKLICDFTVDSDEWGKGRKIRFQTVVFDTDPERQWRWGQFLKAAGYIDTVADITPDKLKSLFTNPDQLQGRTLSAKVIGHSWKQRPGTLDPDFPRSYGANAQPVPTDGTAVFEDLGMWAPAQENDTDNSMRGLAEFVTGASGLADNASSLESYL